MLGSEVSLLVLPLHPLVLQLKNLPGRPSSDAGPTLDFMKDRIVAMAAPTSEIDSLPRRPVKQQVSQRVLLFSPTLHPDSPICKKFEKISEEIQS